MKRRAMVLLLATVFLTLLVSSTALAASANGNGKGNGNSKCDTDCAGDYSWVRRGRGNG